MEQQDDEMLYREMNEDDDFYMGDRPEKRDYRRRRGYTLEEDNVSE